MSESVAEHRVTFRQVLAIREFRALYFAHTLSVIGDQVARIAIAILVYDRTHSSLLTGASYATSYLPWLIGGPTLSVFADRCCRRNVMIACDLGRAVLIAGAASPGMPTVGLLCLVAGVGLLQPPFTSARVGLIPEIVGDGAQYRATSTLGNATGQLAVVAGFGAGGAIESAGGPSLALILDALTFVASAIATARHIEARPRSHECGSSLTADMKVGLKTVFGDEHLRWLVVTSWIVVGTAIATEALAVPYANAHGEGSGTAGILTAALPLGTFAGALLLGRVLDASLAERLMRPLALATPLTLSVTALNPDAALAAALWFAVGATSAMSVTANRVFIVSVPTSVRGRAFGVAASGIAVAQGLGTLAAGLIARHTSPANAVSIVAVLAFAGLALREGLRYLSTSWIPRRDEAGNAFGAAHNPQPRTIHETLLTTPSRGQPAS